MSWAVPMYPVSQLIVEVLSKFVVVKVPTVYPVDAVGVPQSENNHDIPNGMSQRLTKPTKWHVCPAKTQISLGIRPVRSASLLSA